MDEYMELASEFSDLKSPFHKTPFVIAGPCSAESEEQMMETAKGLVGIGIEVMRAGIWKPRTRPGGFEGSGAKGLEWFKDVKQETGLKIATEIATPAHLEEALKTGIDILWIGARTVCNPFSVQAIADALKGIDIPVLVKNPISPDLNLWIGGLERIHNAGIKQLGAIHRGFFSHTEKAYRNVPIWEIAKALHQAIPNLPILFDPSHTGGKRKFVATLSQEAMSRNYDGLIIESHYNPEKAWTDANQQVTPEELGKILKGLVLPD